MKKDVVALDRIRSRFIRRTAFRCNVDREAIVLPTLNELFDKMDLSLYIRLKKLDSHNTLFKFNFNNLRSGGTITTAAVAKNDRVNNMYAWRACRMLRL